MASGFFALFDDIAALMDDVAVMTKVAGRKTAAVLGDDLAVNAQKASGFASSRELPVIWAITKGSFLNKLIVLPLVFLLDLFYPPLIHWLLLIGGAYLAFEGAEKVVEWIFHKKHHEERPTITESPEEILAKEKKKIRSAIITDLILSLEIVIIAISATSSDNMAVKVITVSLIAFLATIGVYGLVALIVRLDDIGLALIERGWERVGRFLIWLLPKIIKALSYIGTIAMILVGGGIFVHNIEPIGHLVHSLPSVVGEGVVGLVVGFILVGIVELVKKIKFS
ncbi:MAG: DUF808 domain-containing protein [Epsilonproteobacteria bacterium]|nr:DUF808 domain-containing protein [Campylobacterota bacterium]NPA56461.1 DUF808 domain-containing protein [Campylobacterota bacterium]